MARFVEADGLEEEEKLEGLRAMLEGALPPVRLACHCARSALTKRQEAAMGEQVNDVLRDVIREWENLKAQAENEEEGSDSEQARLLRPKVH